MENYILIAVLLIVLGGAVWYIVRSKRRGQKCIGCPHSDSCGKTGGCSGCTGASESKK